MLQGSVPLLLLHGPPAVGTHPQGQLEDAVSFGGGRERGSVGAQNSRVQERGLFAFAAAQQAAVPGGVRSSLAQPEGERALRHREQDGASSLAQGLSSTSQLQLGADTSTTASSGRVRLWELREGRWDRAQ